MLVYLLWIGLFTRNREGNETRKGNDYNETTSELDKPRGRIIMAGFYRATKICPETIKEIFIFHQGTLIKCYCAEGGSETKARPVVLLLTVGKF